MKNLSALLLVLFLLACQSTDKKPEASNETTIDNSATEKEVTKSVKDVTVAADKQKMSEASLKANYIKSILTQLGPLNYQLKNFKELPPEKSNMNAYINLANRGGKYNADLIDMSGVRIVRRAFIKGTKPTSAGGDSYPSADLEFWECNDEATAKAKTEAIDKLKKEIPWDVISKSPITYWQDGSLVVLLTPGGMYMLDEVPKIRKFLEEKM